MLRYAAAIGALLLIFLSFAVVAEEQPPVEYMVVTGTRTAKAQIDSPVRTQVVGQQELQRIHARNLKDALENVSGLQLTEIHGKSGYKVSLQGLTSDQVLVLLDGLPVISSTGSTADVNQFALSSIDHIEVVKGASSAQYGSSAMGGVINLISKVPEKGILVAIQGDVGSYGKQNIADQGNAWRAGLTHGKAIIEGGSQAFRARVSAEKTNDDGFSVDPTVWARQGDANQRGQYALRLDWLPDDGAGHFWLDASAYREDSESRYSRVVPPAQSIAQNKQEDVDKNRFSGGASWQWDNGLALSAKGVHESYQSRVDEFSNFVATDKRQSEQQLDYATGQIDLPYWFGQVWTLGASYHYESLSQAMGGVSELDGGKAERESYELFVQNDIFIGDNLELLLGGRWQDDSDFGQHAVPKASLRYTLSLAEKGQLQWRASFGQGYRVPNLKERHFLFDHSALGYKVIGNPNLKPERSDSWQLGVDYQWQDKIQADINLFYNDVRDLIQTDEDHAQIVNGISYFSYINVGQAKTQGVEMALRYQPIDALSLNVSYTYTQAKDIENAIELTRRPKHIARLGLDWTLPSKTVLSLRDRYQSSELVDSANQSRSPSWNRLDVVVNQPVGAGFKVFLGINNLFNKQRDFVDADDFSPITGRFVYLGFRYQWQR